MTDDAPDPGTARFEQMLRRTLRQHAEPALDQRLGSYRLVRELGRGGMATVYLAEHVELGRQVALKVMRRGLSMLGEAQERFRREARAASRIDHAGICPLFEVGEHDGTPFMAMRYVPGETLAQKIARAAAGEPDGLLPADRSERVAAVVQLFEQAALALHAAHEAGLVHRDLKPSNLMVTPAGAPVLLDFGVAFDERAADQSLTMTGQLVGTPLYMAPEQVASLPVDRRTDVYALGLTLYEALTLDRPFAAPSQQEIYRNILETEAPSPLRHNRAVPRELAVVVATAMDKDPDRRYRTAADLAEDLRRVRLHEPIRARPLSALLRLRRWTQRNPTATVAGVVLALATSVVAWALLATRTNLRRFQLAAVRLDLDDALQGKLLQEPSTPELGPRLRTWVDGTLVPLLARAPAVQEELDAWQRTPPTDRAERYLQTQLARAREDFAVVRDSILPRARVRAVFCFELLERMRAAAPQWAAASAAIQDRAQCPQYDGLVLTPQLGLLPIGRDPDSGLWEFAHLETGEPALRDAAGHITPREQDGLVLVLVPGGSFMMGAERPFVAARTPEPVESKVPPEERPRHKVTLLPFFVSKFEMTQAQWQRATGRNPSTRRPDRPPEAELGTVSLLHPVNGIAWPDADALLRCLSLTLPTEAQWEYAARAGTGAAWWTGNEYWSTEGAGNLAGPANRRRNLVQQGAVVDWDDDFILTAPVGSFRPNPWGLHDVIGNVAEWCLDWFASYSEPVAAGTGERQTSDHTTRVHRGGSFAGHANAARSSSRGRNLPGTSGETLGVRPARSVAR